MGLYCLSLVIPTHRSLHFVPEAAVARTDLELERTGLYPSLVEEAVEVVIGIESFVRASVVLVVDSFVPVVAVQMDLSQFVSGALEVVRNVVVQKD